MENQTISGKEEAYDPVYKELGPNDPRSPRKLPVLKIILSVFLFMILTAILISAIYLVKHQEKYLNKAKPVAAKIEASLSPYPKPENNACGNDARICTSGNVSIKKGIRCEFTSCPDTSDDITKFWTISSPFEKDDRTFSNLDLKYNFNAPSNWDFIGKDSGFIIYSPNFDCTDTNNCVGSSIQMSSSLTTGMSDIEDWYKSDENIIAINSGKAHTNNYKINNIGGLKILETDDRKNSKTYYIIDDNTVLVLGLKSASTNDFLNSEPVFNKIISSLNFTKTSQ